MMTVTEILNAIEAMDHEAQQQLWQQLLKMFPREDGAAIIQEKAAPGIFDVTFDDLTPPADWPPVDYALNLDHYLYGTPKRDA